MGAQRQRACVLGANGFISFAHNRRAARLGDLHERSSFRSPRRTRRGREPVDVEAGLEAGAHIFDAVGERVGELEILSRRLRM